MPQRGKRLNRPTKNVAVPFAFPFTSYDAASGGSIVNQVERLFNGFGQMTAEYQQNGGRST